MAEQRSRRIVDFPQPQPQPSVGPPANRLDSWKEIAAYLGRGARTVQRWEREQGLPVHRLQHDKLGSVYAYRPELDAWWTGRRRQLENEPPPEEDSAARTVAVLPFLDMSREKDQEYFCEGVAEEIINALSKVAGLRVASRTSSFQFRGAAADVREIGRRLRVANVLEGSVRKSGNRLRIAVQLTGAGNGYQLWSEVFDREISDVFAVQEQIARSVARALEVPLSPDEKAALGKPPTKDIDAYDYYLRGRTYYYRYSPRDVECAARLFESALDRDPQYPLAWAGLADCWSYLFLYSDRSAGNLERAEQASRRAVDLDPASAQALASRGLALSLNQRDAEAEAAFESAVRLDPALFEAHYFFARHCFVRGQAERAAAMYEKAIEIRPEDYQAPLLMAQIYDDLGRGADARARRLHGIARAEERLKLNPDDHRALYMAANGLAALGERARAREYADRALAMRPDDGMALYNIACVYALLGSHNDAIVILEKAVDLGLRQKGWFEHDTNLEGLREDPRFRALLGRLE